MLKTFNLVVPVNGPSPVSRVSLILTLANTSALTLTITDPRGALRSFDPLTSGTTLPSVTFPFPAHTMTRADRAIVARSSGDIARNLQCVIDLILTSDFDPGTCATFPALVGPTQSWTISCSLATSAGPATPDISGVCHISWRPGAVCSGTEEMPSATAVEISKLAKIDGKANQSCAINGRNPADVALVLDRSGSMSLNSNLSGVPITRIAALHQAVQTFITVWNAVDVPGDKIALVSFDDVIETPFGANLQSFDPVGNTISGGVTAQVTARNLTSIGGGMKQADSFLTSAASTSTRRVMLVMSDGMQNTAPNVGLNPAGTQVQLTGSGPTITLPSLPSKPYQIYNLTVGPSAAVEPAIKNQMSNLTGGAYLNTEENGTLLTPFFVDLLGNFLRFNSWQTSRLIHGAVSLRQNFDTDLFLSTTTQRVVCSLSWPQQTAALLLTVIPPALSSPPNVFASEGSSGTITLSFDPIGLLDAVLPWRVSVAMLDGNGDVPVDFDLVVLVEEVAVSSELAVVPADYKAGDRIALRARLSEFSEPLVQLGADQRNQLLVQVVHPGQSVGDLLSDNQASTKSPTADNERPEAARLQNLLIEQPGILGRNEGNPDIIALVETEPGVYTGEYQADTVGHYNFLFAIEAGAPESGRFSRQQLRTVYARAVPDTDAIEVATSVQPSPQGNTLAITFTPRTRTGNRMGPGWANYFWFTSAGVQPFKSVDNLNGSYSASMSFQGATPPAVSLYFLDVLQIITDDTPVAQLPIKPGEGKPLIERLPGTGSTGDDDDLSDALRGCLVTLFQLLIAVARLSIKLFQEIIRLLRR